MRSAGLKNITARHICLAAQAIGIIAHLIPHLKAILLVRCTESQSVLLNEFDRLLKVRLTKFIIMKRTTRSIKLNCIQN